MQPVISIQGDELKAVFGWFDKAWIDAAATAMNRTSEEALAQQRGRLKSNFLVRNPNFILPPVQLGAKQRATPKRLFTLVALGFDDGPNSAGARRVSILSKFGTAQPKAAKSSLDPIAIPTKEIRPSPTSTVPRGLYPKNLRVIGRMKVGKGGQEWMSPKAAGTQRKLTVTVGSGKEKLRLRQQDRTFVLPGSFGKPSWGVWERIGPGARDIREIWMFRMSIRIPKRLDFEPEVRTLLTDRIMPNFDGALKLSEAGTLWGKARR